MIKEKILKIFRRENKQKIILVILIILNIIAISILSSLISSKREKQEFPTTYHSYVSDASEEFKIDEAIIFAIIKAESNFEADAVSSASARGLMQLTKVALDDINQRLGTSYPFISMFDPKTNIRCGTCYFATLYKQFGDYKTAVAAYNAGPGNVSSWLNNSKYSKNGKLVKIPYKETADYVERVMEYYYEYQKRLQ